MDDQETEDLALASPRGKRLLGSSARRHLMEGTPLALQFLGTLVGTYLMARHLDGANQAAFLLLVPVVSQLGFWSDFGRSSSVALRQGTSPESLPFELGAIARKTIPVSVGLSFLGILLFVGLPLSGQYGTYQLIAIGLIATLSAAVINFANLIRQGLLLGRRTHAYFWSFLWITALLPILAGISLMPLIGIALSALLFLGQQLFLLGTTGAKNLMRGLATGANSRTEPEATGAIGISLISLVVSSAADLALVARFAPEALLSYYGVTRLAQALLSFSYRPLEAAVPDIAESMRATNAVRAYAGREAWRRRRRDAYGIGLVGSLPLAALAPWLTERWLGPAGRADAIVAVSLCFGALVTLGNRERCLIAVGQRQGSGIVLFSLGELCIRLAVGAPLLILAGSVRGLAAASLLPAVLLGVQRRLTYAATTKGST